MINIAVLVSGGGTNLQALIDAERNGNIPHGKITCVISSTAGAYALERAANAGIEGIVVSPKAYDGVDAFDAALEETLKAREIDFVILAGYLSIVGPRVLARYAQRIINVHPSLIPSFCGRGYYGLKVHQAALNYGVKVTGATVHYVSEVVDGGEILLQKAVQVLEGDTPETLQRRVMEQAEWELLPKAAAMLSEKIDMERGSTSNGEKKSAH